MIPTNVILRSHDNLLTTVKLLDLAGTKVHGSRFIFLNYYNQDVFHKSEFIIKIINFDTTVIVVTCDSFNTFILLFTIPIIKLTHYNIILIIIDNCKVHQSVRKLVRMTNNVVQMFNVEGNK